MRPPINKHFLFISQGQTDPQIMWQKTLGGGYKSTQMDS